MSEPPDEQTVCPMCVDAVERGMGSMEDAPPVSVYRDVDGEMTWLCGQCDEMVTENEEDAHMNQVQ